jgi:hypothetical protein
MMSFRYSTWLGARAGRFCGTQVRRPFILGRLHGSVRLRRDFDQSKLDVVDRQRLFRRCVEAFQRFGRVRGLRRIASDGKAPPRCVRDRDVERGLICRRLASSGPVRLASARLSSGRA